MGEKRSRDLLQWQRHEPVEYILYEYLCEEEVEDYVWDSSKQRKLFRAGLRKTYVWCFF